MEQDHQHEFVQLPRCILEELLQTVLRIAAQPDLSDATKQVLAEMASKILKTL